MMYNLLKIFRKPVELPRTKYNPKTFLVLWKTQYLILSLKLPAEF